MYTVVGTTKTRTARVLWMLEEMGVAYTHEPIPPHGSRVAELNPSGKVPVLIVDDTAISDSVAIMTFLADRHGDLTYPAGTIERAKQDSLTQMINDELDAVLWTAARHSFVLPPEQRVPEIKESLRWEWDWNLSRLSDHLGDKPFLMGDKMTIADILCTQCLGWAISAKFPVTPQNLRDYFDRMRARPAWARAMAA